MPNILVRNVPPDVHVILAGRAREQAMSLQQYVLQILTESTARRTTRETIARWAVMAQEREARGEAIAVDIDQVNADIDAAWEERTDRMLEVIDGPGGGRRIDSD